LQTLVDFLSSLVACRNPNAMASSPSLSPWDAKFFHLTSPPAEATMLPVAPEEQTFFFLQRTVHRYRSLLTVHTPWLDVLIVI
jgi:hypothetical protein